MLNDEKHKRDGDEGVIETIAKRQDAMTVATTIMLQGDVSTHFKQHQPESTSKCWMVHMENVTMQMMAVIKLNIFVTVQ